MHTPVSEIRQSCEVAEGAVQPLDQHVEWIRAKLCQQKQRDAEMRDRQPDKKDHYPDQGLFPGKLLHNSSRDKPMDIHSTISESRNLFCLTQT